MYALAADAARLMRLNVKPAAEYRYSLPTVAGALLAVGAVHAASVAPWFQGQYGVAAFMFCLHVLKWPVFSWAMNLVLGYYGQQKQNFAGLILVSEVLAVPLLLNLYLPEAGFAVMVWQSWAFVVTVLALMRLSGTGVFKVLLGYVLGFLFMLVPGLVLLGAFSAAGWIDIEQMNAAMLQMLQQPPK